MLPEIPVEAQGHGDSIVQLRTLPPPHRPVGLCRPGLPGCEAEVGNLVGRDSDLDLGPFYPDHEPIFFERIEKTTLPGLGSGLQAHLVPHLGLHQSPLPDSN